MRTLMVAVMLLTTISARAQWRVGATTGGNYNFYSMDKQYMSDYEIQGSHGLTAGVSGQYNFKDWMGVRVDLNFTQKNYQMLMEYDDIREDELLQQKKSEARRCSS